MALCTTLSTNCPAALVWTSTHAQKLRPKRQRIPLARRHPARPAALNAAPAALSPLEQLEPPASAQWLAARQLLEQELGLDAGAADGVLAEACGWCGQGYWRRERVRETPDPEALSACLAYLRGLDLTNEDVAAVLAAQPEVAGLPLELMQRNVELLQSKWFLQPGKALAGALRRKPRMLGNLVDCSEEGSCQGLCTRCWAQC
eukprot:scaffold10.g2373.t1